MPKLWMNLPRTRGLLRVVVPWYSGSRCARQRCTLAIAREIPDSFELALAEVQADHGALSPHLSMSRARQQHEHYIKTLRSLVPVLALPALIDAPDCCFVEDTIVAIGDQALITRMGHPTRHSESSSIKSLILQFGMQVYDMSAMSDSATCDGGDILYTERHLFIGLSDRTNQEGAELVAATFSALQSVIVPPIGTTTRGKVAENPQSHLHLKSAVTHMNPDALLVPTGPMGDHLCAATGTAERAYKVYRIPDLLTCNVVSCNGTIIGQDTPCVKSRRALEEATAEQNMDLVYVDTSELAKKDAALTCCSILLSI
jgi:dimethylargininase